MRWKVTEHMCLSAALGTFKVLLLFLSMSTSIFMLLFTSTIAFQRETLYFLFHIIYSTAADHNCDH